MDPRLQQENQGKKQKQHQREVTWAEAALLSWGVISCEHLGPHSGGCVPRTPPWTYSSSLPWPPRCLRGEVKADEREVGVAPERCGSGQCSPTPSPCIALKFTLRVGEMVRGADVAPQAFKKHPETPPNSRTPGQGSSQPIFSSLQWWKKWEKVLEKFQQRRQTSPQTTCRRSAIFFSSSHPPPPFLPHEVAVWERWAWGGQPLPRASGYILECSSDERQSDGSGLRRAPRYWCRRKWTHRSAEGKCRNRNCKSDCLD